MVARREIPVPLLGLFIALGVAADVLGCPGCMIAAVMDERPELPGLTILLGVWTTLFVVGWVLTERKGPARTLLGAAAACLLATCTPDDQLVLEAAWSAQIPIPTFRYGLFLGLPLLIAAGRGEALGSGILIGLLAAYAWPLGYVRHAWGFLLGFIPTLVLVCAYFAQAPGHGRRAWRVAIVLLVLLGPWVSLPVAPLSSFHWWASVPRDAQAPCGDVEALEAFVRMVPYVLWVPPLLGLLVYAARQQCGARRLPTAALLAGLLAAAVGLGVRAHPFPRFPRTARLFRLSTERLGGEADPTLLPGPAAEDRASEREEGEAPPDAPDAKASETLKDD
jgi:hypothetical protein